MPQQELAEIIRIDQKPNLVINRELQRELPPLTDVQKADLETVLKRDGVRDSINYWIAPSGKAEIIDGHNRHEIATRLHLPYSTAEIDFSAHYTITAVKYWMHVTQSGRRGGVRNLARMAELQTMLKSEAGQIVSKAEIHRQVAEDANVTPDAVKKAEQRETSKSETKPSKTPKTMIERILEMIAKLSDDEREMLRQAIEKPSC